VASLTITSPVVTASPVAFVTVTPIVTFDSVVFNMSTLVIVGIFVTFICVNSSSRLSLSLAVLFSYLAVPLYTTSTVITPFSVICVNGIVVLAPAIGYCTVSPFIVTFITPSVITAVYLSVTFSRTTTSIVTFPTLLFSISTVVIVGILFTVNVNSSLVTIFSSLAS